MTSFRRRWIHLLEENDTLNEVEIVECHVSPYFDMKATAARYVKQVEALYGVKVTEIEHWLNGEVWLYLAPE